MWVVSQNNVREYPHIISDYALLSDMHITVKANIVPDQTITLNIRQGTHTQIFAGYGSFTNRHAMTCLKPLTKLASSVNN